MEEAIVYYHQVENQIPGLEKSTITSVKILEVEEDKVVAYVDDISDIGPDTIKYHLVMKNNHYKVIGIRAKKQHWD